jgi:uncharacterized repeat protein (TIGR01451 family)
MILCRGARRITRRSAPPGDATTNFAGRSWLTAQAFLPDGFQLGSHWRANQAGAVHHYLAWKALPGRMAVASYIGNGLDNRDLPGAGFRPGWVIVKQGGARVPLNRSGSVGASDASLHFENTAHTADGIQTLAADGFQVGTAREVNETLLPHYWMAFSGAGRHRSPATTAFDMPTANEGNTVAIGVRWTWANDANCIEVTDLLPPGLTYLAASASQGSYSQASGIWTAGDILASGSATLTLTASVDFGTAATVITSTAAITAMLQEETDPANNTASADIAINQRSSMRWSLRHLPGEGATAVHHRPQFRPISSSLGAKSAYPHRDDER